MSFAGPDFVVAIIAISTVGWLVNNWIRARHGYALEDEFGGKTGKAQSEEARQLRQENEELRQQLDHFADRVMVLERIVTDRSYQLSHQIEELREPPKPRKRAAKGATKTLDAKASAQTETRK